MTNAKETIIKSALKYLVKMQIEQGSVGFAVDNDHDHDCCWDDILAWIEAQPSEDCISRQAVLDVINFEDEWLFDAKSHNADTKIAFSAIKSKISELPSVTPRRDLAETSQDCISREAVQDLISRWLSDYLLDETREALETINYKVGDMPSVTPERPKGKWIRDIDVYRCNKCLYVIGHWNKRRYNYCPNCGAEMSGGSEDEV